MLETMLFGEYLLTKKILENKFFLKSIFKKEKWIMKNVRIFKIKYLAPTNTKGLRLSIKDCRNGITKIITADYGMRDQTETAIEYLREKGIEIASKGEFSEKESILISNNFEISL